MIRMWPVLSLIAWLATPLAWGNPGESDYEAWRDAYDAVASLRLAPGNAAAHTTLAQLAETLPEHGDDHQARCGMLTLGALASIIETGVAGAGGGAPELAARCAGSGFEKYLSEDVLGKACGVCRGTGSLEGPCERCRTNPGRCPTCGGSKRITVRVAPKPERRPLPPRRPLKPAEGVKGMGPAPVEPPPPPPQATTTTEECRTCGGSGECPACQGRQIKRLGPCTTCSGTGNTFTTRRAQQSYKQCLDDLEHLLVASIHTWDVRGVTAKTTTTLTRPTPETLRRMTAPPSPGPAFKAAVLSPARPAKANVNPPATQPRKTEAAHITAQRPQNSLLDALLTSKDGGNRIALDERLAPMLRADKRPADRLLTMTMAGDVLPLLATRGITAPRIRLGPQDDVLFLTSSNFIMYARAMQALEKADVAMALQILAPADATADQPFALHAAALRDLLLTVGGETATIERIKTELADGRERLKQAASAMDLGKRMQESLLKKHDPGIKPMGSGAPTSHAKNKERAEATLAKALTDFQTLQTAFTERIPRLTQRIGSLVEDGLIQEEAYWLTYLDTLSAGIQSLATEFTDAGMAAGPAAEPIPALIAIARTRASAALARVAELNAGGVQALAEDSHLAVVRFASALEMAPANLQSVAGQGLALSRCFQDGLRRITTEAAPSPHAIARRFRDLNKRSYLALLADMAPAGEITPGGEAPGSQIGRAGTMLFGDLRGVVPVAAIGHIEAGTPFESSSSVATDSPWRPLADVLDPLLPLAGTPINLSEAPRTPGEARAFVELSQWARTLPEKPPGSIQVIIDGQLRLSDLGAAGTALGVALQSSLSSTPIRSDVAMTGRLGASGRISPIRNAVPRAIAAARSPGIELVILPAESEPWLAFLPPDVLCDCIFILANDMYDYVKYATDPGYKAEGLRALRRAQLQVLLRQSGQARPQLEDLAALHPEFYNARRLLELMNLYPEL